MSPPFYSSEQRSASRGGPRDTGWLVGATNSRRMPKATTTTASPGQFMKSEVYCALYFEQSFGFSHTEVAVKEEGSWHDSRLARVSRRPAVRF